MTGSPPKNKQQPSPQKRAPQSVNTFDQRVDDELLPVDAPEATPPAAPRLARPGLKRPPPPPAPKKKGLTAFQKSQLGSGMVDTEKERQVAATLGRPSTPIYEEDDDPTGVADQYDGDKPAEGLSERDLWKAIQAPVQSPLTRRAPHLLEQVVKQFAVGANPRYEPDAPGKPRAHIFVWDVSRAMACEIPHFVGAKELSLVQTMDWLRHEGHNRGWVKAAQATVFDTVNKGQLVIALPKDVKVRGMAVLMPQAPTPTPILAGAGLRRGNALKASELFGASAIELFFHA